MAKIIQVMTLQDGEYETITGLGSDGILYELKPYGEWAAISKALEEKVAPKLSYCADGSGSGLIEFFYENNLIESLYYINNAEGKFKAFKKVFEAGYYAKTTLDKGE